jgi:DNA uptake protein ComE-like DNA-binding protein
MLILTVLATAFATSAHREVRAAENFATQTQRFYAARGALNYALSAMAQVSNNGATYAVIPSAADTDANGWRPIGDLWVKTEIVDTASCLDINSASVTTLELLPIFRSNPDIAQAIVDWRTPGDQPSPNGAKSDYYETLTPPYDSKDAPYDTVDELLLVKGVTPALLYGSAAGNPTLATSATASSPAGGLSAMNAYTRSRQATSGPGGGGSSGANAASANTTFDDIYNNSQIPLAELLTTVSKERNVASDGTARVNINSATQQDLQQTLGLTPRQASALVNFRNGGTGAPGGGGQQGGGPQSGGMMGGGGPGAANGGLGLRGFNGSGPGLRLRQGGNRPGLQAPGQGVLGQPGNNTRQAMPGPGGAVGGNGVGLGNSGAANPGGANNGGNPGGNPGGNGGGNNSGTGNNNGSGGPSAQQQTFKTIADLLEVPGFTQTVMQQIADRITTDSASDRQNVININTAPAEVLATIPGMDQTTLQAILNYRQNGQAFQTLNDLFTLPLQRPQFQRVLPQVSTKSSVYSVHIKVRREGQPGVYAVSALVELTANGPQVLQWREVPRTPGWASWVTPPALPMPATAGTNTSSASGSTTGGGSGSAGGGSGY